MNTLAPSRTFALPETRPNAVDFNSFARCLMLSRGDRMHAAQLAESSGASPRVQTVLRAAVTAGTTTDTDWAGNLTDYRIISSGFMESLRAGSAFDAMLGSMKRVPLGKGRIVANSTVLVGATVGEGKPKPVSQLSLTGTDIDPLKVSAIVVLSEDIVKLSPAGTAFIGSELKKAVTAGSDAAFIAAMAAAAAPITGSADPGTDLAAMLAAIGVSSDSALYLVLPPLLAGQLAVKHGVNGFLYPGLAVSGGDLGGLQVLVSDAMADDQALLVDASRIAGDAGTVVLDSTSQASLTLDDDPPDGVAATVSLWQLNLLGLRAERWMSFLPVGDAAALADGVTWGA